MNQTDIQETEEITLPDTLPEVDISDEQPSQENTEPQEQGYEIVLSSDEKNHTPETNAKYAARRIARKRQRELEQAVASVTRGEVPDSLKVTPALPPQPEINAFLSDAALGEKYGYDTTRALAAFNAAQNEWLVNVQDARSQATVQQSLKTQEFTRISSAFATAAKAHYDAAEKLNLPDFEEKEEVVRSLLPAGMDAEIMSLFPEKSAALFYHLGANPEKLRELLSQSPQQALISLTRLSERLTIKARASSISKAPPVDEPITGDIKAANLATIHKQMRDAANKGDIDTFRKYKKLLPKG